MVAHCEGLSSSPRLRTRRPVTTVSMELAVMTAKVLTRCILIPLRTLVSDSLTHSPSTIASTW